MIAIVSAGQQGCQFNLLLLLLRIIFIEDTAVCVQNRIPAALPGKRKRLQLSRIRHNQWGPDLFGRYIVTQEYVRKLCQDFLSTFLCLFLRQLPGVDSDCISSIIFFYFSILRPFPFLCFHRVRERHNCEMPVPFSCLCPNNASVFLQQSGCKGPHMHCSRQQHTGKKQLQKTLKLVHPIDNLLTTRLHGRIQNPEIAAHAFFSRNQQILSLTSALVFVRFQPSDQPEGHPAKRPSPGRVPRIRRQLLPGCKQREHRKCA